MELKRYICLIACLYAISCTETPDFREFQVPEIDSITSLPETHTAVLISELKSIPAEGLEAGFYIGTDKNNLKRTEAVLSGKSFRMEVVNLTQSTTYFFKGYVTNGINEIASGLESFITASDPPVPDEPTIPEEPVTPEDPSVPEEPENPEEPEEPSVPEEPEEPENPEQPEDPEQPENPDEPDTPAEFTVEIAETNAKYNNDILELSARLNGDIDMITECWFMVGTSTEKLSKIQGSTEDDTIKAYLMGLGEGVYYYKAAITNGAETKESDICQISISQN